MAEKTINVRLYFNGDFWRTIYICGDTLVISSVEAEEFSYIVLMQYVKIYLNMAEIGGVYVKEENAVDWQ